MSMRASSALFVTAGLVSIVLAACGGGGGSSAPVVVASAKPAMGTLTVKVVIPNSASAGTSVKLRKALSVASSTNGILFTVYPHMENPSTQAVALTGLDVSPTSANCTTSGTTRTCSVAIAAPAVSTNDVLAQTYDQIIPASGAVPGGAHLLAAGNSPNVPITAGATNSISVTLNPVLSTVSLSATPAFLHLLVGTTLNVSVLGYDAGGNLILSGAYVDQNGNPVSVSLAVTGTYASYFTPSSATASGSGQSVTLTYNGGAGTAGSVALAVTAPFASTTYVALRSPTVYNVTDTDLNPAPTSPPGYMGIAVLNAGSNYVFYNTPSDSMRYINGGSNSGVGSQIPSSQAPATVTAGLQMQGGLLVDTAHNLLFSGGTPNNTQFSFTPSSPPPPNPQVAVTCAPNAPATCTTTGGLATDGSTYVYYGNGVAITQWPPGTSAFPLPTPNPPISGSPQWGGVHYDSSSAELWAVDTQSGGFVYMNNLSTMTRSNTLAGSPFDVTTDLTTHNAWVTVPSQKQLLEFATPLITGASPSQTITTTGTPEYVTADSSGVWVSETDSTGHVILGHYNLSSGVFSEVPLVSNSGGLAGPIVDIGTVDTTYGTVFAIVHYGNGLGTGEVLLVVP